MTDLLPVAFADPRLAGLLEAFGTEMDERYPGSDASRAEADDFRPPGAFLLALDDGTALACGGVRPRGQDEGEVKRMYVAPAARGRGLARTLLRALVAHGREQGWARLVLEAGVAQPEALGLYASEGFTPIAPYGQYRDDPRCRCFELVL